MKLYEAMDLIYEVDEEIREIIVRAILKNMTSFTHSALHHQQLNYDGSISFKEYIVEQNRVLLECIKSELSSYGKMVRISEGLEPLTRGTEITFDTL